ncbi:MAG: response regulator [Elusimicrobiales bacterium]|jgi:CheY-like chemotaxis protein|nr:response regulator [Elusimicrobiales bacterium]
MALILIVDDNDEFRGMVADYFGEIGYKIAMAMNGAEGLARARELKPDLIICDVMMPDVGGIEVLRGLQADEDTRSIPVLVMTGTFFDKQMSELFRQESNCREFMSKTTELAYVQKKVEALLGGAAK